MNIFDYAMQMEEEGAALYKEFAASAPNEGLETIFHELADEERKHYEIFKKMKAEQDTAATASAFLNHVKGIFQQWKEKNASINLDVSQTDIYRKAQGIEQKSIDFYMKRAEETDDVKQKEIFQKIASEEKSHYDIMENIIAFLTTPETWIENAEFSKIGEEY